ncbi:hypothetical protein D9753_22915 [Streptomyces dangxiongensis]|uniref:Uncharacterized protein n=1 Tax=Streptomyces dangxiongensis TaxID=1442032 RepID=A0A3G2JI33_9ACTN|nr:hypothetical protein [Streptomyces dangxiongensis]AYN41261.1 hypothetical protein D9753_22915 [Streptomyces dangxiongensis]
MIDSGTPDARQDFYDRVVAATADTRYRPRRTVPGFDLTVDVPRSPLTARRISQVHTYRVVLHPQERRFSMTDIVRTVEYEAGLGGVRTSKTVSSGRNVYVTWSRSLDGTRRHSFSSAAGHRLIRGVARELGWEEIRPTSVKAARAAGLLGAAIALGTLIACAVVFLF